jgi:hypothetical protein
MKEAVHHPAHYGGDTVYEAIKVIDAWELGFCLGNTVKYISRAGKKSKDALVDLKKAAWYLNHEIGKLEGERENRKGVCKNSGTRITGERTVAHRGGGTGKSSKRGRTDG